MANSRVSDDFYEAALVDTDPGDTGYYTNEVNPREKRKGGGAFGVHFSISGTGSGTIELLFKTQWDTTFQVYNEDFEVGDRKKIDDGSSGVTWKAGLKNVTGELSIGFDW